MRHESSRHAGKGRPSNSPKRATPQGASGSRSRATGAGEKSAAAGRTPRGSAAPRSSAGREAPVGRQRQSDRDRDGYGERRAQPRSDSRDDRRSAGRSAGPTRRGSGSGSDERAPSSRSAGRSASPRDNSQRDSGQRDGNPRRRTGTGAGARAEERRPSVREQRPSRDNSATSGRSGASSRPARQSRTSEPKRAASSRDVKPAAAAAIEASSGGGSTAGSSKERYPKAEFARREGMLEGLPAVMEVNRALKSYPFKKDFEWCLRLAIGYNAGEDGQPLPKEEQVLELLEQRVFGLLKKSVNGHYVGHTSWGGSREFVFYIDDGAEAEEPLNAFASSQKRPMEFSLECDTPWANVTHYFNYTE